MKAFKKARAKISRTILRQKRGTGTPLWLTNSLLVCRPVFLPDQSEAVWVCSLYRSAPGLWSWAPFWAWPCSAVLPPLGGIKALISVFVFREAEEVKSHTFSLLHCSGSVYQILSDGRQIAGCCFFFFFPIDENTFLIWLHSNQVK